MRRRRNDEGTGPLPKLRAKTIKSREYAVVTLGDAVTKRRRDFYLGERGTEEAQTAYLRLLADWREVGRRIDGLRSPGDERRDPEDAGARTRLVGDAVVVAGTPRVWDSRFVNAGMSGTL